MANTEDIEVIQVENPAPAIAVPSAPKPTKPKQSKRKKAKPQNKATELKGIYFWVSIYFKFGYYSGAGPFRWNAKTKKGERVLSLWHRIFEKFNLVVALTSTSLQIFGMGLEIYRDEFHISDISTLYLLGAAMMTGYTVVFQIHIALKAYHVNAFNNHGMDYLQFVANEGVFKNPKKFDRVVSLAMGMMLFMLCIPISFAVGAYFVRCDFHLFAKTLPTCGEDRQHLPLHWVVLYALASIYCTIQNVAASTCYIGAILGATLGCRYILDSMTKDVENEKGTVGVMRDPERWLLHYRCLRMVFNRMNICMGEFILPFFLLFILVFIVILNYGIFILDFSAVLVYGAFVSAGFAVVTSAALYQGAHFVEMTDHILHVQRTSCSSPRTWFAKVLLSCTPVEVNVGPYFKIGKDTVMEFLNQIQDNTINVALMDPSGGLEGAFG